MDEFEVAGYGDFIKIVLTEIYHFRMDLHI